MLPSHSLICLRSYITGVTTALLKQFSSKKYYSSCYHAARLTVNYVLKHFLKKGDVGYWI